MKILALDLGKRSCGWALWGEGEAKPRYGRWVLGSEYTDPGYVYAKLHSKMLDHYAVHGFDHIIFEDPIPPGKLHGDTNIDTLKLMTGLAAHAQSFSVVDPTELNPQGIRDVRLVNVGKWRAYFLKGISIGDIRKEAKARNRSATDRLKLVTKDRCREFGWHCQFNDESDALAILDFAICKLYDLLPPWRVPGFVPQVDQDMVA